MLHVPERVGYLEHLQTVLNMMLHITTANKKLKYFVHEKTCCSVVTDAAHFDVHKLCS